MPTRVPNFNILALLITEIKRDPKIKSGSCWSQTPPSGQIFTWSYSTCKCLPAYQFQLTSSNSFWDKEGVPKFNVVATTPHPPCRTPYAETFVCAPSTWQGKTASKISASYLYASCSYAYIYFSQAFHCMRPKMFLGVLRAKMWKYCVVTPKKHYPAWLRVCWCIACQNRFNGLISRWVETFCVQRNKTRT